MERARQELNAVVVAADEREDPMGSVHAAAVVRARQLVQPMGRVHEISTSFVDSIVQGGSAVQVRLGTRVLMGLAAAARGRRM